MPQITSFYDENRAKGLHIFNMFGKEEPQDKIDMMLSMNKINFTVGLFEGNDINNYPSGAFPYTYVIGVDGNVKFQGDRDTDLRWMDVVEEELAKVQYPFLGMRDVPKQLAKAATAYTGSKYGEAYAEANKLTGSDDSKVAEAATALAGRVGARVAGRKEQLETAKAERRYHHAVRILEELSSKAYSGLPVCEESAAALKELKKDKAVKAELKAWEALEKLLEDNKEAKVADRKKALIKFYEKNEGMAAADEARKLAEAIS